MPLTKYQYPDGNVIKPEFIEKLEDELPTKSENESKGIVVPELAAMFLELDSAKETEADILLCIVE